MFDGNDGSNNLQNDFKDRKKTLVYFILLCTLKLTASMYFGTCVYIQYLGLTFQFLRSESSTNPAAHKFLVYLPSDRAGQSR